MTDLHLDYETASELNLKEVGSHKYAAHPSTRILMLGWAFDDEPVSLWEPHKDPAPPARLIQGLLDPTVIVKAFNAPFERLITFYKLGIPVAYERWRCVMVKAYYLGFSGGLDDVLAQIGLRGKDPRGGQLINKFCKPAPKSHKAAWYDWRNAPDDWADFCGYCVRDVEVERDLDHWLDQFPAMHEWDWRQYFLDQRINDRGVPLDVPFATRAVALWQEERQRLDEELRRRTGLGVASRGPALEYFNQLLAEEGCRPLSSMRKDYLTSRIKNHHPANGNPIPDHLLDLIALYQGKEAKAATKYQAVLNCVQSDGRARGMFQYKGASRTDRVGGRRLQLQNLKHPVIKKPEEIPQFISTITSGDREALKSKYNLTVSQALGSAIRHVINAPEGRVLTVGDWTSIESVVLGWIAQCDTVLQTFRAGRDSYKTFGANYYRKPYDQVTKEERSFCKPPVLGCGYMLGWNGLIAYAEGMGVKMDEGQARQAVDTFRGMYPEIVRFWYWLYDSVKYVVTTGRPVEGYRLYIERDRDFLRIWLPSGRALSYFKPEIMAMPAPWDHTKLIENFTYMGKEEGGVWTRISAHAGGVTENIVQSIASDVLWFGISNCMAEGIDVILHVHDEIGAEADEAHGEAQLARQLEIMRRIPPWGGTDLWLGAAGMVTKIYTKD